MSLPKSSAAYPPSMLAAVDRAIALGKFLIPTTSPGKLRFTFYGLLAALRRENAAAEIEKVSFHIKENGLEIRLKADENLMQELDAALAAMPPADAPEAADALFSRLAGGPNVR